MQTIIKYTPRVIVGVVILIGILTVGNWFNLFNFHLPGFGHEEKAEVTQAAAAEVIKIEPIQLDCRARITASIPIKGKKDYRVTVLGATQTYRTDTVTMTAIGDIDTCVDGGADIRELADGGWLVQIPSDHIRFVRPRVDAVATAKSVDTEKGWVGKLTDIAPWVSDDNGLTEAGYAYAQSVVGSSSCMEAAWQPTLKAIETAYHEQALAKGLEADQVEVVIGGSPDFAQNDNMLDEAEFEGFTFAIQADDVECKVATDAAKTGKEG
jgi:hypothetical protein